MDRALLAVVIIIAALVLAAVAQRRKPDAPVRTGIGVPDQLDRADFANPHSPWLVAVFTDASCATCAKAVSVASALESSAVSVETIERTESLALHERYRIDSVPTTCVVDTEGVVRASFLGPPKAADLWAAVADLREDES